jgi:hypothetical protein
MRAAIASKLIQPLNENFASCFTPCVDRAEAAFVASVVERLLGKG